MTTNTSSYNKTDTRSLNSPPSDTNAALRGAALAFAKPPAKPNPNTYNGKNGALAAATLAESTSHPTSRTRLGTQIEVNGIDEGIVPQYSGSSSAYGSIGLGPEVSPRQTTNRFNRGNGIDHLALPFTAMDRSISPSHIAATIAASRSASTTPNSPTRKPMFSPSLQGRASNSGRSSVRSGSRSRDVPEDAPDTTSIPPTTSLIGMFEKSAGATLSAKRQASTTMGINPQVEDIKSPVRIPTQPAIMRASVLESPKPVLPMPRHTMPSNTEASKASKAPALSPKSATKDVDKEDASSDDSFVSAPDYRPRSATARIRRPSSVSADSRTIDAMANAIVASSLASSRAGSPSKVSQNLAPPLPPPRRNSPAKGLRTTMRKPPKTDEEEDLELLRRGRKNIMKKHPNKHHEGDRKRWRDRITERERKRYEAVWASNRGLYVSSDLLSFPPPPGTSSTANILNGGNIADSVSNIVVRDIWSRSRLGNDVLSEVWELVDRTNTGRLSREEFVVGLWLIDQRLKGRKLPIRVGDSVWSSIGLGGVKVRGNGSRKR
jgi:hypothetical protein